MSKLPSVQEQITLALFFAESRRRIDPTQVRKITEQVPQNVGKVGVFVSPSVEEVQAAIQAAQLTAIQLHGKVLPSLQTAIQKGFCSSKDRSDPSL